MMAKPHITMLATQYLANTRQSTHPCHRLFKPEPPPRQMKGTLDLKYATDVDTILQTIPATSANKTRILKTIHTSHVTAYRESLEPNKVLNTHPPRIALEEQTLSRTERCILAQLRSGYCNKLNSYKHRVDDNVPETCQRCNRNVDDTTAHLFECDGIPNVAGHTARDLWREPCLVTNMLNNAAGW